MKEKPEKKVYHGVEMWVNPTIDQLRATENLCVNCRGMFDCCEILEKLSECFKDGSVLMMIFGCPYFEGDDGDKK